MYKSISIFFEMLIWIEYHEQNQIFAMFIFIYREV